MVSRSREQIREPGVLLDSQVIQSDGGEAQVGVYEYVNPIASERPDAHKIKLYDCVDQSWTSNLDREAAYQKYLHKVFAKCSACNFGTAAEILPMTAVNTVKMHVTQGIESYKNHAGAYLVPQDDGRVMCTGCSEVFSARKGQARKHLEAVLDFPSTHNQVDALLIRRFALEPQQPEILRHEFVYEGSDDIQIAGVAGMRPDKVDAPQQSRRKRRRSRNGRTSRQNL
jgi:hypothetical protein